MKIRRSEKQKIIMEMIFKAADEGHFMNIRELQAALPYKPAYASIRWSVKYLEEHGMIVKERSGAGTMLVPTLKGYQWFRR